MSWTIIKLENTALVPLDKIGEVAVHILHNSDAFWADDSLGVKEALGYVFWDEDNPNTIQFDGDDMEHMDYVTGNPSICEKLAAVGTTGRILFGSLEGDNKGQFWGVEFASGHYRKLSATTADIQWNTGTSMPGK